jgi:hypothetical protein
MTTSADQPDSLVSALAKARIPAENHDFIRRFTTSIGIADYRAMVSADKPHVIANRRDDLPELHIYSGYTNGFTSKDEIVSAAGLAARCARSTRKPTWYVEHPATKVRAGGARSLSVGREGEQCDRCHQQMPLSAVCDNCD